MDVFTPDRIRRITLLGAVITAVDAGAAQVPPGQLMQTPGDDGEREQISSDARALGDEGLLNLDERLAGMWTARPTAAGRQAWQDFTDQRDDPLARARYLRNQYLRWLYLEENAGRPSRPDQYAQSGASYLGAPFDLQEIDKAGAWLKERGFLKGPGSWGTEGPILPTLTAKGVDHVENDTDVHLSPAAAMSATSTWYVFNAPAQVAHHSDNARFVQVNSAVRDRAAQISEALRQLVELVGGEERDAIQRAADELQKEAAGEARPERLKAIGEAALRVLSSGAGGAIGAFVSDQITQFLGSLPL